jgi:hypothetical protein
LQAQHDSVMGSLMAEDDEEELDEEQKADLKAIRGRKRIIVTGHRREKSAANNRPAMPSKHDANRLRTASRMQV